MPTNYSGAAAWCERMVGEFSSAAPYPGIALRAVRAFDALASGRVECVKVDSSRGEVWQATTRTGQRHYSLDPLDAITMAIREEGA